MKTKLIAIAMVVLLYSAGVALIYSASPRKAEKPNWLVSYVCYKNCTADSIGCAIVAADSVKAAKAQFHKENFGERCDITAVEKAPDSAADDKKADYWQFEKWLCLVHQEAPCHHLKLQWGEPTQEEFFYLYCWQSNDHSIEHAIQKAKEAWQQ